MWMQSQTLNYLSSENVPVFHFGFLLSEAWLMKKLLPKIAAILSETSQWLPTAALLLTAACIPAAAFAQKQTESVHGPSVASHTPEFDAPASDFAGPDSCKSCHKEVAAEYGKTTHAKLVFPGKDYIRGCETCHGPAKGHADAIQAAHGDDAATAKALKDHP